MEQWFLTCAYRCPRDSSATELKIGKNTLFWDTASLKRGKGKSSKSPPQILFKWIKLQLVPEWQTGRVGGCQRVVVNWETQPQVSSKVGKGNLELPHGELNGKMKWFQKKFLNSHFRSTELQPIKIKLTIKDHQTLQKGIHDYWVSRNKTMELDPQVLSEIKKNSYDMQCLKQIIKGNNYKLSLRNY